MKTPQKQTLTILFETLLVVVTSITVKDMQLILFGTIAFGTLLIISTFFWFQLSNLKDELSELNNKCHYELKEKILTSKEIQDIRFQDVIDALRQKDEDFADYNTKFVEVINQIIKENIPNHRSNITITNIDNKKLQTALEKVMQNLVEKLTERNEKFYKWKYLKDESNPN